MEGGRAGGAYLALGQQIRVNAVETLDVPAELSHHQFLKNKNINKK